MARWGLLLLNLGTPDAAAVPDVRRYLREFLSDPRVLDIHPLWRAVVLHLFILPFRPRQSAGAYRKIWTERGSPLLVHGQDLAAKMGEILGGDAHVELAMRYQNPPIGAALESFRRSGTDDITVFPLFPQYSSSAFGSAVEKVFAEAGRRWNVPSLQIVPPYYDHPAFIRALASVSRPSLASFEPDKVLMSFHGLPERQVIKSDETDGRHCLRSTSCCEEICTANRNCYRAQCFATARALARELDLADGSWEVTFQSRLGRDPWIQPFTDVRVRELGAKGTRRLAVLCPSFVADCLETLEEIGLRARDDFSAAGGGELIQVPCLNSDPAWVEAVVEILGSTSRQVAR